MTDPFVLPDPTSQQARALESTAGDGYVAVVMLEAALKDEEVDAAGQRVARGGLLDLHGGVATHLGLGHK